MNEVQDDWRRYEEAMEVVRFYNRRARFLALASAVLSLASLGFALWVLLYR